LPHGYCESISIAICDARLSHVTRAAVHKTTAPKAPTVGPVNATDLAALLARIPSDRERHTITTHYPAPPDHRQPNLPKRKTTRLSATMLSSATVAGRCSPSVFSRTRRIRTRIATCCDRGRDTPTPRIRRTGRYSRDSAIAGSNSAHGSCATGGRRPVSLHTSMNTGATVR